LSAENVRKSALARMRIRVVATGIVAIVVVAGFEFALLLAGYGHDTSYLHRSDARGHEHLRDNAGFGVLFFPEHLRPRALPFSVPAEKPQGHVRIVVLGGSEAMGMPEPAYGVGPMLQEQLGVRHPGVEIEVVVLAHAAANSHVVRRISTSLRALDPDGIVVMLGNDEVIGPYGAGTIFTARAPSSARIAWETRVRSTRLGQWWARRISAMQTPERWRGSEMFASNEVSFDDPALERTRVHFSSNLDAIARAGDALNVPMVFTTLGVNLRHSGPFGTVGPGTLPGDQQSVFGRAYRAGDELWERGAADSARISYREALTLLPLHADLHYRLGRLELAAGDTAAAIAHLRDAREYDTVRLRADAGMNGVVRRVATWHDHVILADLDAALAAMSPAGLPGREAFLDHKHLDFAGNRIAARVLADALEIALRNRLGEPATRRWPNADELATSLAYTPHGRLEVVTNVLQQLQRPPFSTQSDHLEQVGHFVRQLDALAPAQEPERIAAMWPMVEAAVAARPGDRMRRLRAARYLAEAMQEYGRSEQFWSELADELPHSAAVLRGWGRAVAAQGRFPQAVRLFEQTLELDPYQNEVKLELAAALRRSAPDDPQMRRRALDLEETVLLVDGTAASHAQLRGLYEEEVRWSTERGDLARVRILRTKLDRLPAD
jgi:tetratricopeptide (TPR) repeat protein